MNGLGGVSIVGAANVPKGAELPQVAVMLVVDHLGGVVAVDVRRITGGADFVVELADLRFKP